MRSLVKVLRGKDSAIDLSSMHTIAFLIQQKPTRGWLSCVRCTPCTCMGSPPPPMSQTAGSRIGKGVLIREKQKINIKV